MNHDAREEDRVREFRLEGASLVALVVGSRYSRYFVCLGAGIAGWALGDHLGELMHVQHWFVALPCSLITAGASGAGRT